MQNRGRKQLIFVKVVFLCPQQGKAMMQNYVSVVFDRKKKANTNKSGKGKIELYIRLNRECRKYLTIGGCTPNEWKAGIFSTEAIEK